MTALDLLLGSAAVGLLLFPGWRLARAWHVPQPLVAGFIGGAVAFMALVLALDTAHVRLSFATVGTAWFVIIFVAIVVSRWKTDGGAPVAPEPRFAWRGDWPLLLPLVPALAVVSYRAIAQPLFGADTIFRWDWLALQMHGRGTLGFYPPVSAADYEIYPWPDGIAPVVSSLYYWAYSLARATRPELTAPVVIVQFVLLAVTVHALAWRIFSERAAAFATALLACSPVVLWAIAMGQETGLTALSLAAMLLWLPAKRSDESTAVTIAAGLAAALGGLSREYGLAWPVLGLVIGFARGLSRRTLLVFAAAAALGTLPWYARNWTHTGNPLFNLDIAGWFPINATHVWLMQSYQQEFGWSHLPPEAVRLVLTNCAAVLLAGLAGAWLFFRSSGALLAAVVVVAAVWLSALAYTAAGFIYGLRVLSPALAVGAALGGAACARWIPAQRHLAGVGLALTLFATDAALRTLTLPGNVYKIPPGNWLATGRALRDYHERPIYREFARIAGTQRLIVLGPNTLLTAQGAKTTPLWSPDVRFIFDAGIPPDEIARRLRNANFGFILLGKGLVNDRYLARSAFFRDPHGMLQPVWADPDMILLKIVEPTRK